MTLGTWKTIAYSLVSVAEMKFDGYVNMGVWYDDNGSSWHKNVMNFITAVRKACVNEQKHRNQYFYVYEKNAILHWIFQSLFRIIHDSSSIFKAPVMRYICHVICLPLVNSSRKC